MEFCERLKDLRKENHYTQKDLSKWLGLTPNSICEWEKKRSEPSLEHIIKLSRLFNVSTDYLLGRTDELGSVVMPSPTAPTLADDERKLLDYYGQMSHPMKIRVIAYCEGLLSTGQSVSSKRNA